FLDTGPQLVRGAGQAAELARLQFQQRDEMTADVAAAARQEDGGVDRDVAACVHRGRAKWLKCTLLVADSKPTAGETTWGGERGDHFFLPLRRGLFKDGLAVTTSRGGGRWP